MTAHANPRLTSTTRDTDHFVIGDGSICCVVEWNHAPDREPYGLLLAQPGRMARREGTLLWHPEHRLRRTMLTLIVDGERFVPQPVSTTVSWEDTGIRIQWRAGELDVIERFWLYDGRGDLARDVRVRHPTSPIDTARIRCELALYGNPTHFDDFTAGDYHVAATGSSTLLLWNGNGKSFERFLEADSYPSDNDPELPNEELLTLFEYKIVSQSPVTERALHEIAPVSEALEAMNDERGRHITEQLTRSVHALRASVSREGRFNASLFQYEFEWGLDAAFVASAAVAAGEYQLAREVLTNILTRLSDDEGRIAEASRFRAGELSELNGNGAVLDAVARYWRSARDESLVRAHWLRITAIAEYPLRDEFAHESGLLRTRRDVWERYPWQGVGDGFELGHQVLCAVGLRSAAELADVIGDEYLRDRWSRASQRIATAMLEHPTHSLVENGRFIRRRLVDGSHETSLVPDPSWRREEFAPYLPTHYDTAARSCEPDITEILPIVYGLVDPASDLARTTLDEIERLWSPTGIGGYARYDIASEPDSPGPWPFASMFVAMAELACGDTARAVRTVDWLLDVAGPGGSWLEYYGERESPPHPPIGLIVWGWAQYILLVVESMAGVRIERNRVAIRPRIGGLHLRLRIGDHMLDLRIDGLTSATLNDTPSSIDIALPLPLTHDHTIHYT